MSIKVAPASTCSPTSWCIAEIVPGPFAAIRCSIFIASITISVCPVSTSSPTLQRISRILPGIGAVIPSSLPEPLSPCSSMDNLWMLPSIWIHQSSCTLITWANCPSTHKRLGLASISNVCSLVIDSPSQVASEAPTVICQWRPLESRSSTL